MKLTPEVAAKARKIRLVLMDVDGVMTDGSILYMGDGNEVKAFHAQDGVGIKMAQRVGLEIGVITGRQSAAVERRCAELGIDEVHQGDWKKRRIFEEILSRRDIAAEAVAFIGDDLVDLPVLRRVGFSATVADARDEIRDVCDVVCELPGGRGAVREILEAIIKAQGRWDEVLALYV